jgi:hypothetical protein
MRTKRILVTLVVLFSLSTAPAALAGKTKTYAPPGKAGSSEYSEVIPASGGNVAPPSAAAGNTTAAPISKLGQGRVGLRKLAKLGKRGAAAAQFAQATAPTVVANSHTTTNHTTKNHATNGRGLKGGGSANGARTRPTQELKLTAGGSALSGIGDLLGGSDVDGIGILLPLLLAFGLGAAATVTVQRLRRGSRPPA